MNKLLRNLILYVGGVLVAIAMGYLQTQETEMNYFLVFGMVTFIGVASFGAYLQTNNQ